MTSVQLILAFDQLATQQGEFFVLRDHVRRIRNHRIALVPAGKVPTMPRCLASKHLAQPKATASISALLHEECFSCRATVPVGFTTIELLYLQTESSR